jgi:hypothetical protein
MFRTYRPHGLPQRKFICIIFKNKYPNINSFPVLMYTNKLPLRNAVRPIRTENEVIVFIIYIHIYYIKRIIFKKKYPNVNFFPILMYFINECGIVCSL